ncbi:LuxR C-terminal-related transcriptional regulator [Roseibium sp. HPY-6]|uniref:response regulator transcription factor n=1 Tax=Roseibium sp. HPY-6 TaxID=3229852 RepID=UPI00338E441D
MTVDAEVVDALKNALDDLRETPQTPIPVSVIEALAPLAERGAKLKIDLEASRTIGAPLITVVREGGDPAFLALLTPRQKEVARLIIAGKSNREIAKEFGISVATVKDHVHAVLQRLNLPSRRAVMTAARATQ